MGAICEHCKQDMKTADGCTWPFISKDGGKTWVARDTYGFAKPGERCSDCGALYGHVHHYGCDAERCPFCGHQLIFCDCEGDFAVGNQKDLEEQTRKQEQD